MRQRARTDGNHSEIVEALRRAGCTVLHLHQVGGGCPDVLAGIDGRNLLIEIKDGSKPPSRRALTADETTFHAAWRGQIAVVTTVAEALELALDRQNRAFTAQKDG